MKTKLKYTFIALLAGFGLLQLTNPDRTNPPVTPGHDLFALNPPPPQVAALMHAACFDCHSQETRWPWYSRIAPVSWLVASDVKHGRAKLNFSDWPVTDPARAARKFGSISDVVDAAEMPPKKYTLIHADADLSADQRKAIVAWAEAQVEIAKDHAAGAPPK
jgi:hypothetical protein